MNEEIKAWMMRNYPKYADNEELARALYEKFVQKKEVKVLAKSIQEKTVASLIAGERVKIRGVVMEVGKDIEYQGCKVHKKSRSGRNPCKECSPAQDVEYAVHNFYLGDETGSIWVSQITEKGKGINVSVGDEVEAVGLVKEYKDDIELMADDVRVVEKRAVMDILVTIKESKEGVSSSTLQEMLEAHGVAFEDIRGKLIKEKDRWKVKDA